MFDFSEIFKRAGERLAELVTESIQWLQQRLAGRPPEDQREGRDLTLTTSTTDPTDDFMLVIETLCNCGQSMASTLSDIAELLNRLCDSVYQEVTKRRVRIRHDTTRSTVRRTAFYLRHHAALMRFHVAATGD